MLFRSLPGGAGDRWSRAWVANTADTAGSLTVEFYDAAGARVGDAYSVPIAAKGSVRLDLKDGLDLPPAALTALVAVPRSSS